MQRTKIFFGLHLLPRLQKKSKIFFCFGGCLPRLGKPWLVGRTFPGTDFTEDLIAVAISQLGLSGYAFPPAMSWLGCSKEPLLPLHSCACTHLRICSGRPAWGWLGGASRKGGNACSSLAPDHLQIFSPTLAGKFCLGERGCLLSAWLSASSLVPFFGNWALQREMILSTSMAISKVFPRPLVSWSWRKLQSLLLECRAWLPSLLPWVLGPSGKSPRASPRTSAEMSDSDAGSWWGSCLSFTLPVSELLLAKSARMKFPGQGRQGRGQEESSSPCDLLTCFHLSW